MSKTNKKVKPFDVLADKDNQVLAIVLPDQVLSIRSDDAVVLAYNLLTQAETLDPLAQAKLRGLSFGKEMAGKMHLLDTWKSIPNYQKVADAFMAQEGHFNNDLELLNFFISQNIDIGPYDPLDCSKCRSPIQALEEGDVDACMRAVKNWMK